MKKKLLVLLIIILFTTGCTCEYNLNIVDNDYMEAVNINADNQAELNGLNVNWQVPTDKEEYNIGEKPGTTGTYKSELYDYKLTNNTLTFNHTFTRNSISKSSAISNCYDMATIKEYDSKIIISTSTRVKCFDKYPELSKITITINTDKNVINNNADYVNGKNYIWYLDKTKVDNRPINMTIDNRSEEIKTEVNIDHVNPNNNQKENNNNNNATDYTLYIFCAILLLFMLTGYYIFNKIKKKSDEMDD